MLTVVKDGPLYTRLSLRMEDSELLFLRINFSVLMMIRLAQSYVKSGLGSYIPSGIVEKFLKLDPVKDLNDDQAIGLTGYPQESIDIGKIPDGYTFHLVEKDLDITFDIPIHYIIAWHSLEILRIERAKQ